MSQDSDDDDNEERKVKKRKPGAPEDPVEESVYSVVEDESAKDRRMVLKSDLAMQSTEDICCLYLRGYSLFEISKAVKLSLTVVRKAIDQSRQLWIERHNQSLTDLVAEQIAKIDRVEAKAWESYEESRKNTLEKQNVSGSNDKGAYSSTRVTKRRQAGSADFLTIVLNCVKQRSQLLGLNERKEDDAMRHNSMLVVVNSPEEARAIHDYQAFQKMIDGTVIDKHEPDDTSARQKDGEVDPCQKDQ